VASSTHPHRRFNPLTREWLLVSPHRTDRPWQGQMEKSAPPAEVEYDPRCYLCPGNARAGGARNPQYTSTFVFTNDYSALLPDTPAAGHSEGDLLAWENEPGICRVVCFSPRHDLTIARMDAAAIRQVVDVWADQYVEIGALPFIGHVQIFENRGEMMGASNPHPHCQIWATAQIPDLVAREQAAQADWLGARGTCLLCAYLALERDRRERVVCENDHFTALVPWWAVWPFETIVLSRRHIGSLDTLDSPERDALADIMKRLTSRYDKLFDTPFPYTMGFHQQPTDGSGHPEWHLHAHYLPPLLRSATVRKFMVGFEMLDMPQRDITPESAAERLRDLPE
jgi:UDPglucose--hexose-1-phosphate uridylyltransferase